MLPTRFVSIVFSVLIMLVLTSETSTIMVQAAPPKQGPPPVNKDPKLAKIGHDLVLLYEEQEAHRRSGRLEPFVPSNPLVRVKEDRVVIDAMAAGDANILRVDLEALGLQQAATFGRMVSGRLPVSAIEDLAALDSLRFARPAYAMTQVGLTTTQGDEAMRADLARTTYGVDGTGVTIGTLSDSYNCLGGAATDVSTGDLPLGIVVLQEEAGCSSGSDEGRGMMQLIRDVAPGADQAFHTAFNGEADFASGIVELASSPISATVIVDDVIYLAEPMFQDGIIAQAVDTVKGMGVSYFSSAGNNARMAYESGFVNSGSTGPSGRPLHDFDSSGGVDAFQRITVPVGVTVIFSFQWDQPYASATGGAGSASDIDIYLADATGFGLLAGGLDFNVGSDPVEVFGFLNDGSVDVDGVSGPDTTFNILIERYSGPSPGLMKYIIFDNGPVIIAEYDTASGTVYGHANANGAEAVGAAFYFETPEFGTAPALLESFSSAGPTPVLFDLNDNSINDVRDKPEIVCPDGGNTTFFGFDIGDPGDGSDADSFPNFFGTSAAAPHAAAVAALMLEANSALAPGAVYSILQQTAADMGPAGFDDDTGFGFCQADLAVEMAITGFDTSGEKVYLPVIFKNFN